METRLEILKFALTISPQYGRVSRTGFHSRIGREVGREGASWRLVAVAWYYMLRIEL